MSSYLSFAKQSFTSPNLTNITRYFIVKVLRYNRQFSVIFRGNIRFYYNEYLSLIVALDNHTVLLDFSLTVKAAPHECVIRTSQP